MSTAATPRILIVDDEVANMRALCETLAACGFETLGCTDGPAALAALRTSPFDLLLTDLRMPGMDGLELLRDALALDPFLVAVLMTGHGSIVNAVDAMKAGALDYILKPIKLAVAVPVLERALKVRALKLENSALEERLRAQMDDLVNANSDLDAFSYSVSHDLRAPIQMLDGFSAVLESAHSGQLDEKGLHYVMRIRAGAARMGELVDELLRLSRLSRQPLERKEVDVAALVAGVLDNLREEMVGCDCVEVDPQLPPAPGDPALLRQLFANLLSNACKFSATRARPSVQVGSRMVDGECIYFVRDNGVGFDMAYAGQMFQPFQRMHRAEEFPGLGVGLSIVQRVVRRHGGRIWAEAAVDGGACFHFTLAPPGV